MYKLSNQIAIQSSVQQLVHFDAAFDVYRRK